MSSAMGRLTAADELARPPRRRPSPWQENCFVMGYNEARNLRGYFHVERHSDWVDVKAAVARDGDVRWVDTHDDVWPDVIID